jgi:serine/threonine-protein kinase HipA
MRFFELTVFNYIIGNNDMHLKNFSMWKSDMGWTLAPAYDLLNVKLILPQDQEDLALMMGGKKMNFNKIYFDRLGGVLLFNEKQINSVYKRLGKWLPEAQQLIDRSFLKKECRTAYKALITQRTQQLHL